MLALMNVTISAATDEELQSGYVGRQLREFNYRYVGEYADPQYIRLNARDAEGKVVGGIRAVVVLYWLRIDVLWVQDTARRTGIGSRLLAAAEQIGAELRARNAAVETFEWQAPAFYSKHGYVEASRINEYVGQFYLALMTKRL
jgi:GNAT superfamily N-acetyltransferase